jgi:hypothetical protein
MAAAATIQVPNRVCGYGCSELIPAISTNEARKQHTSMVITE